MADSWLASLRRSGWAGSGPKASQAADDRKVQGAEGTMDKSRNTFAQDNYKDTSDQTAAMKRRMQTAGGN